MVSLILPLLLLQSAQPEAAGNPECEAHFFPTDQVQGFTRLGDYGLLSDVLAGGQAPKAELLAQVRADTQFAIASRLLAQEGRLNGFRFVEHLEPVDAKASLKQRLRLTPSQRPCYVEIVVHYISFSDSALTKAKVGVQFVARDFRDRPLKPKIQLLGGAALLKPYVSAKPLADAAPEIDFVGAYSEAFEAAIARFWKS